MPLRVSKEVFKALSTSGIPFSAAKSPPGLSAIFPVLYLFAIYFFVIKRGWVTWTLIFLSLPLTSGYCVEAVTECDGGVAMRCRVVLLCCCGVEVPEVCR